MKILMVISQYYPIIGGAERQAKLLSETLKNKGISVDVITGWWKIKTPNKEILNGIKIYRNFSFWGMFGIKGLRPLGWLTYMITLGIYLLSHRREYDIIHVHQVLYPAFISVLIGKRLLKKPTFAKIGCSGLTGDIRTIKKYPLGSLQLKYLIKHLDCLVSTNQEGIQEYKSAGYPVNKIYHIPNGVFPFLPEKKYQNNNIKVITSVRLDRQKGVDTLLSAWTNVVAQEKRIKLLILGQGNLEKELRMMAKTFGVNNSVIFLGMVNNPENYLKESDIFVLPSRAEGMSNGLLEAMCIGLSCIGTNISGNKELITDEKIEFIQNGDFFIGERGILVNPEDINGLSKAILYLAQNPNKRKELGIEAKVFVRENYSIDIIAEKYIDLYHQLLSETS